MTTRPTACFRTPAGQDSNSRRMASQIEYAVRRVKTRPGLSDPWDAPAWDGVDALEIDHFLPESSGHRPRTQARLLYDERNIYGLFRVEDRYVRCTRTAYGSDVYKDACVEFFMKPKPDRGYLNFEMNCGGALLASYIEDSTRVNDPARPDVKFEKYTPVSPSLASDVEIAGSLPRVVDPEVTEPLTWTLAFRIPFTVVEAYVGSLGEVAGQVWHANFNKCADACSHPHWATWAPIGDEANFHQPDKFAPLRFEG